MTSYMYLWIGLVVAASAGGEFSFLVSPLFRVTYSVRDPKGEWRFRGPRR